MLSKNLFDEKTLEVNSISDYLTVTTPLPQYLPYPRFLLDTDLSHTAKLLYTLLLDRATLSQKNNWMDECVFVYVIFPLSSLSDALRCSTMSIKRALRSLEDADLIERRRGHIAVPNNIFVKVPTEQKCSSAWNDSAPCDGTEMISSIRTIFEQYVNTDTGANGLSKYLETHGFQKLARQNGTSPLFSATLIRAILKNPVYCGKSPLVAANSKDSRHPERISSGSTGELFAGGRPARRHRIGRIVERRTGQAVGAVQTIRTSQPQQDGTGAFIIRPCQVPHLRCWNV